MRVRSHGFAPRGRLVELLEQCAANGVSSKTIRVLQYFAGMPPTVRLASNLQILVALMRGGPIYSVLSEGLTAEERAALVELDLCGLTVQARETAHGLLNIHERWVLMKALRRLFRVAASAPEEFLSDLA